MNDSPAISLVSFLLRAYVLGWAVAAPIGPVNLEIIRRALRVRLAAGFCVGLGATMVDLGYFLLVTIGFGPFLMKYAESLVGMIIGGGILVVIASLSLHAAWLSWKGKVPAEMAPGDIPRGKRVLFASWVTGLGMTAFNPMTIIFWTLLPAFLLGTGDRSGVTLVVAGLLVWLGALSWVLTLMCILAFARRFIGPRLFAIASAAGGLLLIGLALDFWLRGGMAGYTP
jgi:L-lysine exporter family protein LysE/ArgO